MTRDVADGALTHWRVTGIMSQITASTTESGGLKC